jgi:hypothetical protein
LRVNRILSIANGLVNVMDLSRLRTVGGFQRGYLHLGEEIEFADGSPEHRSKDEGNYSSAE